MNVVKLPGRGLLGNKIKKIFEESKTKEIYVKIRSPEEYKRLVRQGVAFELADAQGKIMDLEKQLDSKEKYIESLQDKIQKEEDEDIKKQKKDIEEHKKANEFIIYFRPERPLVLVSSFNAQPFTDRGGKKRPFWVGIKLIATPYGPYMVPLLADKPKSFNEVSSLEDMSPQLYLHKIPEFFTDLRLLVHKMKASGTVEVNVSPGGDFISDQMHVQVKVPASKPKRNTAKTKKKKRKSNEGKNKRT